MAMLLVFFAILAITNAGYLHGGSTGGSISSSSLYSSRTVHAGAIGIPVSTLGIAQPGGHNNLGGVLTGGGSGAGYSGGYGGSSGGYASGSYGGYAHGHIG